VELLGEGFNIFILIQMERSRVQAGGNQTALQSLNKPTQPAYPAVQERDYEAHDESSVEERRGY